MKVVSVNVGLPRDAVWRGTAITTGIFKAPVAGPVRVRTENLEGDRQADLSVHGGPDKAVYVYPGEHYSFWCETLEVASLGWGAFGENLTVEGLLEDAVYIGDRLRVGTVELEVSQPRIPCQKLALRHERADLPKLFLRSGRSGFYCRVAREGVLEAGAAIEHSLRDTRQLSVADVQGLVAGRDDATLRQRAIDHPALAEVWRTELSRRT